MSHASSPTPTALVGVDTNASGQDDDRKQESDSIEKALVIKSSLLEDGELEEGELDDDDDVENKTDQPVFNTASETKILPSSNGSTADESLGKSTATFETLKKPKEIPSLFDLKTTKPKSMKRLIEEKGKMSFPKYIDHDRIDDGGYLNYNGQENMADGMWSGYSIPNNDYESSDCDAVPENEFSVEIQQMLNRSTTGAITTSYPLYDSEKSPRGPYDSPSEDEENDESVEFQPPNKLQKVEEASCVSYGLVTSGSKKAFKKQLMMASEFATNGDNKKTKLMGSRTRRRGEPNLSEIKLANEPPVAAEKRRLVDTPMEERPQCKFYFEGKCKKGVNCPFNHDMKRLTKSEPCHFYMSGQCSKGNDCVFSHELKSSGEEDDRKTDASMPKKRKALLGSPPAMLLRMVQQKDKKKIPSLFDIQINADGPNAKEILQSAARRSVMRQSTNPKPGLLGVAPPMIAATGMIGPGRTGFPIGAQGYFENLARLQPHEEIEDAAQEILRQGSEFTGCGMEENVPALQVNFLNNEKNESLQDREVFSTVEIPSQNLATDLSCSSSMYCSTSVTLTSSNIQFVPQNSFSSDLQSAISVPCNSHYQTIPPESSILSPSSASPLLFPQLGVPLPSSTEETDTSTIIPVLPMVEDSSKPQIVGGVDINHLPPKQRELYLRMFANRKHTEDVPAGQLLTDKTTQRADEEIIHAVENNVNSHSSADLLKLLIPVSSQCTLQSLVPETFSSQSLTQASASSGSAFSINHMLAVICGGEAGLNTKPIPLSATEPAVLEKAKPAESVFVVSDSHLRGPYQLQCVTLEGETSILPSHVDPMDSKYTFDPRVQKHKDEVIMRSSLKPDQQTLTVPPVEPIVKVHTSVQRRDPRLARKEAMAVKEETLNQPQQQLGALSVQYGMMRGSSQQNLFGAVQQGSIQAEGDMQHGNMPVRGMLLGRMPVRGKQQGNLPLGLILQGNMPLESIQHCNMPVGGLKQGNMPMGAMQQSNLPVGSMQKGNMPVGSMQQSNMPMGCMQQTNMSMGGMQQGNMPLGGMQQGNMQVGGIVQGNMPVDGILQGSMSIQQIMSIGSMQQSNMQMGNTQQGNMHMQHSIMGGMQQGNRPVGSMQYGNMPMGGMQKHVNMPVGVRNQSSMSVRPMLQGGMLRAGGGQQSSQMMTCVQQGGITDGSNEQGGMSAVGLLLGGVMPGSHVPMNGMQCDGMLGSGIHQGGMSVSGMQQHMNLPIRSGMQQGGLLPQPSGGFLHQRGLVPPFLLQSQASVISCFPRSVNTQPPFNICNRAGMLQHDMVRPASMPTNHDRPSDKGGDGVTIGPADVFTLGPAIANSISMCTGDTFALVQSNPGFVQPPLLSVPLKATSVIAGPSVSSSSQPSYSSLQTATTCDDVNQQRDIVCSSEQLPVTQLSCDVDVCIGNKDGCNQRSAHSVERHDDDSLTSNVERTLNSDGQDHRFRIKKAQMKDFEENSSDITCNSGMLVKAGNMHSNESNANARKAVVRNKDKLEFRSPLADMGDGGSSLLISGYNQPPNKKYQQLAEENNLRRSVLSKDSGKQKQRSTSHQMPPPAAAQNELLPPPVLNLQPDNMNNELAHSVQSVKDMFKSIDPTASPFC